MFLMDWLSKSLLFVFLIASMFSIGLQSTTDAVRSQVAAKHLFFRLLTANFVVIPLLGVAIARGLSLAPEVKMAFVLLACAPGGISAVQFTSKIREFQFFAGTVAFFLSFLALFISPLLIALFLPAGISVVLPYGRILFSVVLLLLLPLVAGILLRRWRGPMAAKLSQPFALIGSIAFVAGVLLIMSERKEAMKAIGSEAVLAMLLFIILSMLVGWFMGGPARETRQVFATATSMRNSALCLVIALESFPGPKGYAPLVAFSALMIPPNALFTIFSLVQEKRRPKKVT